MIDNFLTWYSTLQGPEQIFWTIALIATAVFAVQMILTIIGIDAHDVADLDFADGDTMDTGGAVSLFSVRSLVNFFVGLGWGRRDIPSCNKSNMDSMGYLNRCRYALRLYLYMDEKEAARA